jgi:hypothetical protein
MNDEEAQFFFGRPPDVRCLATPALLGLVDRTLHRHTEVAQVDPTTWRQPEARRRCVDQREGKHVGRTFVTHVAEVEVGELGVVGKDDPDAGGRRRAGGQESGGCQSGKRGRG